MAVRPLPAVALLCALLWALAGAARAQSDTCDLQAGPPSPDFEHYAAKQWPGEAERAKANRQNVSRDGERLRLKLEKGGPVEMADCPPGEDAHVFLYEDYDEAGRFYVVRRPAFRD